MKIKFSFMAFYISVMLGLVNIQAFVVTTHPQPQTVDEGNSVTFFIETDSTDLSYYWQYLPAGGSWTNIPNATDPIYTIDPVEITHEGDYRCVATNGTVSYNSNPALLSVTQLPPVITDDPDSLTVMDTRTATFTVVATGSGLSYQWQKDSVDIPGAQAASYITTASIADDGALFHCIVSNGAGIDTSAAALLTVTPFIPYDEWTNYASFIIGTTEEWADMPDSVVITDFPVLIRLDSSNFDFSQVLAGGADIRFSTGDELASLPYEIELWDDSSGRAAIWVKLDTITGNSEQTIKMYWGKSDAVDESDGAAVFNTVNGFTGVWHLDEEGNNDSANYQDASGNGFHGQGQSMEAASQVAGVIGNAQAFDGSSDWIIIPPMNLDTNTVTMAAWVNLNGSQADWAAPFFSRAGSSIAGLSFSGGEFRYHWNDATWSWSSGLPVPTDTWVYLTLAVTPDSAILYVGGNELASNTNTTAHAIEEFDGQSTIGRDPLAGRLVDGIIDEVRISSVTRSDDWVKLSFENQKGAQSLVSLPITEGCVADFGVSDDTVITAEGGSYSVSATAKCALRYQWSLVVDQNTVIPLSSEGLTISQNAGRISGDTTFTLRFGALYDTGWASEDVVVEIIDNIPDPEFTISSPIAQGEQWNGRDTITIKAVVSNLAAIKASPDSIINYVWTTSGIPVSTIRVDTLLLRRAYADGNLTITTCLDNGGDPSCQSIVIEVLRPVGVELTDRTALQPVEMQGAYLKWNRHARVRIWSIEGSLLLDTEGDRGKKLALSPRLLRIISNSRQLVNIEKLD
jgi:hypothetical protein